MGRMSCHLHLVPLQLAFLQSQYDLKAFVARRINYSSRSAPLNQTTFYAHLISCNVKQSIAFYLVESLWRFPHNFQDRPGTHFIDSLAKNLEIISQTEFIGIICEILNK